MAGTIIFTYFTPIIFVVGIAGNTMSMAVFTSKSMRNLSASAYLFALSLTDMCTLVFYVLVEWFRRGDIDPSLKIAFLDYNGFCQLQLWLAYISRFMSAWIIVIFTIERFTGVCYPLKRFKLGSKKIILLMLLIASLLVLYKPILTEEKTILGQTACAPRDPNGTVSFILDVIFGLSITLVPFLIITVLNSLIVRELFLRNIRSNAMFNEDSRIRLEFTLILLAISFFFVAFNLPYFVVWAFMHLNTGKLMSATRGYTGVMNITRTIFYLNYCVNFFLYSITGARFRKSLKELLFCKIGRRDFRSSYIRCNRLGSSCTQVTTANSSGNATYCA